MTRAKPSIQRAELLAELDVALRDNGAQTVHFSEAVAERVGIHPTDLETLDLLHRRGPLTAGQIAAATGLRTASVTALIDRLEARDLAHRVRDPADRRKVLVEIDRDRAGQEIAPLYEGLSARMADLLSHYADDQLVLIRDYLQAGYELMLDETDRVQGTKETRGHRGGQPPGASR
jgi:DNA-binding MarR family transcriptional regulator